MTIESNDRNEFLEAALKDLMTEGRKVRGIVIAWLEENDSVTFSYHRCAYDDLQRIGQEIINEGTLRLIAASEDHISKFKAETESDDSD